MFAQLGAFSRQFTLSFNLTRRSDTPSLLNSIRKSTFAQNTISLPEVSVSYGGVFSGIKGICKSYSITIEEMAGYTGDVPNRVKVTMVIAETRKPALGGIIQPTTPG